MTDAEILFDVKGQVGRIHLNQPKTFNSLTRHMCQSLRQKLLDWGGDDAVAAVVVTAEGERPFCAGGDIRAIYDIALDDRDLGRPFFQDEYRLDHAVYHFPKPYVAMVDGIVMGGGVGISIHGSHRVVTERTTFAMPETGIGLFPDVGASVFLPQAPGQVGTYLGLTGARLKAANAIHAGFGTHYVPTDKIDALVDALCAADLSGDAGGAVDGVLADFSTNAGAADLLDHRPVIDTAFAKDTVEDIVEALRAEDGCFAIEAADTLAEKSPTSLKITLRQLREGASLDMDEALLMEYRMVCECLRGNDFFEGIRAAVVDKDRSPKWQPESLGAVPDEAVAAHFKPLGDDELRFD